MNVGMREARGYGRNWVMNFQCWLPVCTEGLSMNGSTPQGQMTKCVCREDLHRSHMMTRICFGICPCPSQMSLVTRFIWMGLTNFRGYPCNIINPHSCISEQTKPICLCTSPIYAPTILPKIHLLSATPPSTWDVSIFLFKQVQNKVEARRS